MSATHDWMTISSKPVLKPDRLLSEAERLGAPTEKLRGLANSVTLGRGMQPSSAWVVVSADVFESLRHNDAQYLELFCGPRTSKAKDTQFRGIEHLFVPDMWIHRAEAVLAGASDVKGPYLLELRDRRSLFDMSAVRASYNVLRPDESDYWEATKNSGTPWTWDGLVGDLASKIVNANVSTALASFPTAAPENFRFEGESAWTAIGRVLSDTGHLMLPYLSASQNQVSWVWRVASPSYLDADNEVQADPTDLAHTVQLTATRVPAEFHVCFPDRDYVFHQDADAKVLDSYDAIDSGPVHTEVIGTNTGQPGTAIALQDSLPVQRDAVSGLITNQSDLTTRATDVAALYTARMVGTDRDDTYAGLHRFTPDGNIDSVTWFDYGRGWQTKVFAVPIAYWRSRPWHYLPENVESHLPMHRKFVGLVTSANVNPGQQGTATVRYLNASGSWVDSTKTETFRNVGLDPIVNNDIIYAEWWWQTREWIAFCGFRTS